jgi:branched-chain amino acid transport system substrate-binding protein
MRSLWAAVLVLSAGSLVGCYKSGGSGDNASEVVIGHVASLTGDTATFGHSADEGIRLALDEINAKGGLLGKKVNVITEDDRSVSDEAKTAANKLITRDHVCAILGEIASSRSIAIAPVCDDAKVPMLSPGSTNPKVTQDHPYVFRNCFIDPFQGECIARSAMEVLKLKRFAMLYPVNSDYGVGLRGYIETYVKQHGGQIVADLGYTEKTDKDFSGQLTKIKGADPEAIFIPGYYTEVGLIGPQARKLGITVPLIGGDGWDAAELLEAGKSSLNGCFFTNHYSPDEKRPEVQAFVEAYKRKYNGKIPDAMAIVSYDAMNIMADAIKRAGTTNSQKIKDALAAAKDFPGASGLTTIDKDHNARKAIVVIEIKDEKLTYRTKIEPT